MWDKLQNKWNKDEARRGCMRAPKYNNTDRRTSANRWTRWECNYTGICCINVLKWNKRDGVREKCAGGGAICRRGIVSSNAAALLRERVLIDITKNSSGHCRGGKGWCRFGDHERDPAVRHPVRLKLTEYLWRSKLQWTRRNLKPILHQ